MKNRPFSTGSVILLIPIVVTAVSGFITWRLFPIPFGTLFNTFFYMTVAGLVACLAILAVMAFRARAIWMKAVGVLPAIIAIVIVSGAIILKIDYRLLPNMSYRYGLTAEQWKEDLRYLAREYSKQHVRLYEMVDRQTFEARAAALEDAIPRLSENSIKMELYKLLALPNDAHSFPNVFTHKLDWHALPFKFWLFNDGVYVLDAGREHRDLIGARLVEIGDAPIAEAYKRLRPYLAAENEFNWKDRFIHCLSIVEFLHAARIVDDPRALYMTFETRDRLKITVEVETYHYIPVMYWSSFRTIDNDLPYMLSNDRRDNWWFTYREDTGTLYFQFNRCLRESGKERIEEFVQRLGEWADSNEFERLVVDIRKNDGGDGYVARQVADLIIGNDHVDRPGRLFVLTSRKTFSAAVMFLSLIENNTKAVIVGEPTGQGPFFCGGPQPITLPNSGLEFLVSRHYNRCSLFDDGRKWIMPDLPVEYTMKDYLEGRDPMMDAVLEYGTPVVTASELGISEQEKYTGRYCLSFYQILTVEAAGGGLRFTVSDFFEESYRKVSSDLYSSGSDLFHTDIDGVELFFSEGPDGASEGVTLKWRGIDTYSEKAPEGHMVAMELFAEGRTGEAVRELYLQRDGYRAEVPGLEARLNVMGYALLREEKDARAVKVFELNVMLFPESANTYDSLGEAYMLSGRRELAIKSYEKALELNPDSKNAREVLEHLKKGQVRDRETRKWSG
ncbi:MAG: tetratricopeptide repeat protein [Candidatus Krumholzibacteria bacterium]|nr:tetratricopeptide repeat protein [Candidatus Krumholzibacteria bacterium]